MRKLFLLAFAFLTLNVSAQSTLTGCMGIDFRSSRATVKSIMSTKPSFEFYKEDPVGESLSYIYGTFGGRKAVGSLFRFYEDQLHSIVVLVEVEQKPKAVDLYYDIIKELEEKYSVKFTNNHSFKYPYVEGDGHETTALKMGYATMTSYCIFSDENSIAVSITDALSVKVEYQFSELVDKAIERNNQKNSKDY